MLPFISFFFSRFGRSASYKSVIGWFLICVLAIIPIDNQEWMLFGEKCMYLILGLILCCIYFGIKKRR